MTHAHGYPVLIRRFGTIGTIVALTLGSPVRADAQPASQLRLGEIMTLPISDAQPTTLTFDAESAGFLTVIVRGTDDSDLYVAVTDDLGQDVMDGRVDRDFGGDMGAEQLTVTLTYPAAYQVRVHTRGGRSECRLAAAWIAFPDAQTEPDPDGRPTSATPLGPGDRIENSLDSASGDHWDWFSVTSGPGGVITVLTEAPDGDLVLEVFEESDFGQPVNRSDQDMGGVSGNESLTMPNPSGGTLYVRVSQLGMGGGTVPYTIRAGVM
jgi:hypothetical protein